jgi:hypothetical protein
MWSVTVSIHLFAGRAIDLALARIAEFMWASFFYPFG